MDPAISPNAQYGRSRAAIDLGADHELVGYGCLGTVVDEGEQPWLVEQGQWLGGYRQDSGADLSAALGSFRIKSNVPADNVAGQHTARISGPNVSRYCRQACKMIYATQKSCRRTAITQATDKCKGQTTLGYSAVASEVKFGCGDASCTRQNIESFILQSGRSLIV